MPTFRVYCTLYTCKGNGELTNPTRETITIMAKNPDLAARKIRQTAADNIHVTVRKTKLVRKEPV